MIILPQAACRKSCIPELPCTETSTKLKIIEVPEIRKACKGPAVASNGKGSALPNPADKADRMEETRGRVCKRGLKVKLRPIYSSRINFNGLKSR